MQTNHSFTTMQCIHAIANWKHEPFTKKELTSLLTFFAGDDSTNHASYEYGEPDIESFILHTLSELEDEDEDEPEQH